MKNPLRAFGPQWVAKTLVVAVVAAGTVTVAVQNVPSHADRRIIAGPRDEASWSMPLDRYVLATEFPSNYAEQLLQANCMASHGVKWPVPWQDPATVVTAHLSEDDVVGPTPRTTEAADSRGYHVDAPAAYSTYLWHRFFTTAKLATKADQGTFDNCIQAVRKANPVLDRRIAAAAQNASNVAVDLVSAAYASALGDSAVRAAEARWSTCLTGAGVSDRQISTLPPATHGVLSSDLTNRFSLEVADAPVSKAEVALANEDLACQASSGYRSALYDAEFERQTHVTAEQKATLDRATLDQRQVLVVVEKIITDNLPAEPGR